MSVPSSTWDEATEWKMLMENEKMIEGEPNIEQKKNRVTKWAFENSDKVATEWKIADGD